MKMSLKLLCQENHNCQLYWSKGKSKNLVTFSLSILFTCSWFSFQLWYLIAYLDVSWVLHSVQTSSDLRIIVTIFITCQTLNLLNFVYGSFLLALKFVGQNQSHFLNFSLDKDKSFFDFILISQFVDLSFSIFDIFSNLLQIFRIVFSKDVFIILLLITCLYLPKSHVDFVDSW